MSEPTDAKWGQPAHSGEPSYLDRLIDRLGMPPQSMTASDLRALHTEAAFMLRMQRSAQGAPPQPARAVLAKFGTPAFVGVEPYAQHAIWHGRDGDRGWDQYHDSSDPMPLGWDGDAPDEVIDLYTAAQAQAGAVPLHVDALAQEIRRVDGRHDLGAGALAESLMPFLSAHGIKGGQHEI